MGCGEKSPIMERGERRADNLETRGKMTLSWITYVPLDHTIRVKVAQSKKCTPKEVVCTSIQTGTIYHLCVQYIGYFERQVPFSFVYQIFDHTKAHHGRRHTESGVLLYLAPDRFELVQHTERTTVGAACAAELKKKSPRTLDDVEWTLSPRDEA